MSVLKVCEQQCDQCLFSKNRVVSKERMAQIVKQCRENDNHFECHKASIAGLRVMCRGFYDTQPPSRVQRFADYHDIPTEFVNPSTGK